MKEPIPYRSKGHIAVGTNSVDRAVNYLESQGVEFVDSADAVSFRLVLHCPY